MTLSKIEKWNSIMIEYRSYIGHFIFDEKKNIFYGRVTNTRDVITFQGKSIKETKQNFRDAINEHLDWCKKHGKIPEKPSSMVP
jgi:predicted HicB family RNase H-like nuclease